MANTLDGLPDGQLSRQAERYLRLTILDRRCLVGACWLAGGFPSEPSNSLAAAAAAHLDFYSPTRWNLRRGEPRWDPDQPWPAARHCDTSANDIQPMLLGTHPHVGAAVVIVVQRCI